MEIEDDIEMKDVNPINSISEASKQCNYFQNIRNGTNISEFIPLEDNSEEKINKMDIEYNNVLLEVNTTEVLDDLIGKYSSEIRANEYNDLLK